MKKTLLIAIVAIFCTSIAANAQSVYYEKGYGMNFGVEWSIFEGEPMVGFSTDQGYRFGNGLFAGINMGVHFNHIGAGYGTGVIIPAMVKLQYNLLDSKYSPYVSYGIGTAYMSTVGGMVDDVTELEVGMSFSRFSIGAQVTRMRYSYISYGVMMLGTKVNF